MMQLASRFKSLSCSRENKKVRRTNSFINKNENNSIILMILFNSCNVLINVLYNELNLVNFYNN
jgi:hypothetical protein